MTGLFYVNGNASSVEITEVHLIVNAGDRTLHDSVYTPAEPLVIPGNTSYFSYVVWDPSQSQGITPVDLKSSESDINIRYNIR